ncbi:hypothetical protein COX58_03365 [archaeon CG_4_10_14_0_2_um_filter_Archaea_38_6]|nr:MAG: hypothetical protein COS83_03190 [archaeon CG07_land_8_20_14_0_80_38_8]PIU88769.1 MAG: hypothetical protein COS64_02695 [archaeon CG06_land_8_20_14_3_00_37_11]PJA21791.1 MAG: hypothetical protein COX58_03365 [archaeon CG_4_10_14_0_2_um_filter_Archaea_38_6]
MIPPFLIRRSGELILLELVYFFSVLIFCLAIYFKTKQIYDLTKHKGIFYFRNIFLYFSLAYFFRIVQIFLALQGNFLPLQTGFKLNGLNLLFISFTSTMALLSVILTFSSGRIRNYKRTNIYATLIIILICLVAFFTRSPEMLGLLQLILLIISIVIIFGKRKKGDLFSRMRKIYLLLLLFWILNLFIFNIFFNSWFKLPLYLVSLWLFYFIFLKVSKRLRANVQKKK